MSKATKIHQPCEECGSSDAKSFYEDGSSYCFSCKAYGAPDHDDPPGSVSFQHIAWRGVSRDTMQRYRVTAKVDEKGEPIAIGFPYQLGTKIRLMHDKIFYAKDDLKTPQLFGKDCFSQGSADTITITEGELDALSLHQVLGRNYPVVSVRSSTMAFADASRERDYLNSFKRIYLCFDQDDAGKQALKKVAALFDFNKIYHVKLTKWKDPNEYLENGDAEALRSCWFNARRFMPEDIYSSFTEFDKIVDSKPIASIATYPFPTLQTKTMGIRPGEFILIKAPEKVGKTEFISAIEYHVLKTSEINIGVIHLEESQDRVLKRYAGYELGKAAHLPDALVTSEEIKSGYRSAIGRDDRLHIYAHFGTDDPDIILDTIRFMVAVCGCRIIFLDHISMVVTGADVDDERKAIDKVTTKLKMMAKELEFCVIAISHINNYDGTTRGSKYITKVCDIWIDLERDTEAEDADLRNKVKLKIPGNRFCGRTGPAGILEFNLDTWSLSEVPIGVLKDGSF